MNPSALFIRRPVATVLLTLGIMLAGIASYFVMPVASLPAVDFPVVFCQVNLPGASPEVMATSVATPLERRFGQIADINELTSTSTVGRTQVIMQFGLDRNVDGAFRDTSAAIQAARADLPTTLRSNPQCFKANTSGPPIMVLTLTSPTLTQPQVYDAASLVLQQKLSQIRGVGSADVQGSASPAVRVDMNPRALAKYGIGMEDIRAAINGANANQPKGMYASGGRRYQIYTNDQATTARDFRSLVVAFRNGQAVRLSDVASVYDGPENTRLLGLYNGQPSIVVRLDSSPGANIVSTVDRIKAVLPALRAELPPSVELNVAVDRTTDIRNSLAEVERTLLISIVLVVVVVLLFLRNGRATLIPAVAVVTSLLGTLAVMFLLRFSLDNLSLMALTVATGFVVDDAIVVLENITRHVEAGMPRYQAALQGAQEVGFTVVSMSISLIAVFLPILMMGGIVGRVFREFSVTLSAAILISLIVSLTTTPMMAARLIDERPGDAEKAPQRGRGWRGFWARIADGMERGFQWMVDTYEGSLAWALDHRRIVLATLVATVVLNIYCYAAVPKGFLPQQDTGLLQGGIQVDQASSFALTSRKFRRLVDIVRRDPAVDTVTAFSQATRGFMFVALKPKAQRGSETADDVINRIRPRTMGVGGAQLFLQSAQDFRFGGRSSNAEYQYTLESDSLDTLKTWSEKLVNQLKKHPELSDVNSDAQEHGLETFIDIDYSAASRVGLTVQAVDNILNDAFSQRLGAVIYNPLNTYHVVMEVAPEWALGPSALDDLYIQPGSDAVYSASTNPVGSAASASRMSATAEAANRAIQQGAVRPTNVVSVAGSAVADSRTGTIAGPAGASTSALSAAAVGTGAAATSSTTSQSSGATPTTASGATSTGSGAATGSSTGQTGSGSPLNGAGVTRSTTGGATQAQTGNAVASVIRPAIPLAAIARYYPNATATEVNHQGQTVATTISFNLPPGQSLSNARTVIQQAQDEIQMPNTVRGSFQGTAQLFADTLDNQPLLIAAALLAVYIVLGMLYESYVHPITVLSTLPSAGIGALLALMLLHVEFDIIGLIGIILLIGIVKKNAILIIDFAVVAERERGLSARDAIYEASLLRFRPILMTTMAAILGALPLAIGFGEGGELRRPLGITIIGGLIASQILTLITTPVVYIYMDKLRRRRSRRRGPERWSPSAGPPSIDLSGGGGAAPAAAP